MDESPMNISESDDMNNGLSIDNNDRQVFVRSTSTLREVEKMDTSSDTPKTSREAESKRCPSRTDSTRSMAVNSSSNVKPSSALNKSEEDKHGPSNDLISAVEEGESLCRCLFTALVLLLAMMIAMFIIRKDSSHLSKLYLNEFEIDSLINHNVIGQRDAVAKILSSLRNMTHQDNASTFCQVVLLSGGPGVGKDYTIQLIKNYFYLLGGEECSSHSHHMFTPGVLSEAKYCWRNDFNLFSFETIYSQDPSQIKHAIAKLNFALRNCNDFKRKLTILMPVLPIKVHSIPSINLKGVDTLKNSEQYLEIVKNEGKKVQKALEESGIKSQMIVFRPLDWDDLKQCIVKSAQIMRRAPLFPKSIDEISAILRPSGHTADFVPMGCKGVDAKVALLPEKSVED